MAEITFTKTTSTGADAWVAEISGVSGTINIDIERKAPGLLSISQKNASATRYKGGHIIETAYSHADLNFNFVNGADNGSVNIKIVSASEVEKAYYA